MADRSDQTDAGRGDPAVSPPQPVDSTRGPWRRRAILTAASAIIVLVAWVVATAVVPRWWAQRVGNMVDGRLTAGTIIGLSIGAGFTMLALVVLRLGWRFRRRGWRVTVGFVLAAVLAATPNLATLAIVFGSGNAAHAGQRTLDVDAPGFRGGSLVGALVGATAVAGVLVLLGSRRRNRRKVRDLETQLSERT